MLASGSHDDTTRLWDVQTGALLETLVGHTGNVYTVVYSPDGSTIASGSWDGTVCLWDSQTSELLETLRGHTRNVASAAFSPDGGTVLLWDLTKIQLQNGD